MRGALLWLAMIGAVWPPLLRAETPESAPPLPAAPPWVVGVRSGYTTLPNFVLGALFERYKPVNGLFVEGVGAHRFKGFTLYWSLSVTHAMAEKGIWQRSSAKTPNEVEIGATFVAADAVFDWEVSLHRRLALHFGAGLGLGALFGTIQSQECQIANLAGVPVCNPIAPPRDRISESAWPLFPVLHLVAGARVNVSDRWSLRVDFDFRNAFGVALGVFYAL
jgi:hypothetical protein